MPLLKPFVQFWCSLRLTVACLFAALVLVFVGTLAQVDQGLYAAQKKYFAAISSCRKASAARAGRKSELAARSGKRQDNGMKLKVLSLA